LQWGDVSINFSTPYTSMTSLTITFPNNALIGLATLQSATAYNDNAAIYAKLINNSQITVVMDTTGYGDFPGGIYTVQFIALGK
ncbi:hypothetical protein, partial [Pectinatus frisingensis]|uniref:gp53-like domain-containing protein n=1 Tax=Pectinatus frisingensis TaxID=865 RepID=UPI0018C5CD20